MQRKPRCLFCFHLFAAFLLGGWTASVVFRRRVSSSPASLGRRRPTFVVFLMSIRLRRHQCSLFLREERAASLLSASIDVSGVGGPRRRREKFVCAPTLNLKYRRRISRLGDACAVVLLFPALFRSLLSAPACACARSPGNSAALDSLGPGSAIMTDRCLPVRGFISCSRCATRSGLLASVAPLGTSGTERRFADSVGLATNPMKKTYANRMTEATFARNTRVQVEIDAERSLHAAFVRWGSNEGGPTGVSGRSH